MNSNEQESHYHKTKATCRAIRIQTGKTPALSFTLWTSSCSWNK